MIRLREKPTIHMSIYLIPDNNANHFHFVAMSSSPVKYYISIKHMFLRLQQQSVVILIRLRPFSIVANILTSTLESKSDCVLKVNQSMIGYYVILLPPLTNIDEHGLRLCFFACVCLFVYIIKFCVY